MADTPWGNAHFGGDSIPFAIGEDTSSSDTSAAGAFAAHVAEGAPAAVGGVLGWEAGAAAGTALAPGPGTIVGGLLGAIGGSYLTHAAEKKLMPTPWENYLARSAKEHPTASFAGELTSQVAAFRPSIKNLTSVGKVLGGATAGAGIEAGTEKWNGEDLDPTRIAMAGASGALLLKPSGLTEGIQQMLAHPSPWMIEADISLNKLLGGENETLSARIGKTKDSNPLSAYLAKYLDGVDPGHTDRAVRQAQLGIYKVAREESPDSIRTAEGLVGATMNEIRARDQAVFSIRNKVSQLVPDAERRASLTRALEHPEEIQSLSEKERTAATILRKTFDDIGSRALDAQVIRGMKENYISHIVDWSKSPTKISDALDYFLNTNVKSIAGRTTSKFAKTRKYETIEELNSALEDTGLSLKTKDPGEILQLYASSMEKAIAGKNLVNKLKSWKLPDGNPLLFDTRQGGFIPQNWQMSPSHFLQGYAIHPDLKPILEHMFYSNSPGVVMQTATAISNLAKRLNVTGSFFHLSSLTQALLSSGYKTFGKELLTGFSGTRAAVRDFRFGGEESKANKWIKAGLILETPIDVDREAIAHIGAVVDDLASKAGLQLPIEKAGRLIEENTMKYIDKITWDYGQTGFKLLTAEKYLEKAKLDHPEVPEKVLRKEIVEYVNNSFGGLNWTQIAAESSNRFVKDLTSSNGRRALNLLFFAPDWTASTLRAFTSMFGKGSGLKGLVKPRYVADFARRYQMRSALIYFTLLNGINYMVSGHPIWDNKDPTRIEFKDGTSMQMSKHAMEPIRWMLEPEKSLANKLGFLPHAAIIYWGEKQYPFGPDLEDKSLSGKLERIGEQALPFQIQAASQAPEGQGLERLVLGSLGLPVYGMTGLQRRAARRRRALERRELRRKIMLESRNGNRS